MAFNQKTWATGNTITAVELNRIEAGIKTVETALESFNGGSGGTLVFATLAELQSAYPGGSNQPAWITSEQSWYYWSATITQPPADTTAPTLTITAGGIFTGTKTISMSATDASSVTIYYTLNGSNPTTASAVYTSPISINATTTIKAFARDAAGNSSAIQSITYTLDTSAPVDTTPPNNITDIVFSNITQTGVTLSWAAVSDAASYDIFRNGSLIGNIAGTTYNATGLVASTTYTFMIKAKDAANNAASGYSEQVTTAATTPTDTTPPTLTITPAATFASSQIVTMTTNETATIWYTTDGSDPKTSGTRLQYTTALMLSATTTIKAYAVDSSNNASTVQTITYTKQELQNVVVMDDFNRANGSLGNANTGQTWLYSGNKPENWTIQNNRVVHSPPALATMDSCYIVLDNSNYKVSVTLPTVDTHTGLVLKRHADPNTIRFVALRINPLTALELFQYTQESTIATIKTVNVTVQAGHTISVEVIGTTYNVYHNDSLVMTATHSDAAVNSNTGYGLFQSGTKTSSYDNFIIQSL